jgi:alkylation response protein AidB-like acyl-CoA dehydrogenase
MYPGLSKACMNVILKAGSEKQKEMFTPKMFSGEWGGTMCLTESGAGSDVGALKTTATPMGDGRYKIKGVKIFISSGESDLYTNNVHLVLAKTPGAPDNAKGLSLFIVPRFRLEDGKTNNVVCSKVEHKMGIHASATCELQFGNAGESYGEMIGKEFDGMATMFIMMNEARLLCGMQGESQANLAYLLTLQYATERVQFANEIIKHPDVRRMLLKMRSISRGMRALNFYTMNLFDEAHKGGAAVQDEIALLTPICKAFCSEEGFNVAVEAMQVHGGYGFCTEYGIEQFARDIKIATIYEGTNGIQSVDFVMRKILKDQGKAFSLLGEKMRKDLTSPEAQIFSVEISTIGKNMEQAQKILGHFAGLAAKKQFDQILQSTNYFLQFSGNLVVSWLLLRGAILANKSKIGANKDDAQYYQTKIDDFKIFCQHHLTRNSGHSLSILNFDNVYSGMEL